MAEGGGMMARYTLEERGGWLYVVCEEPMWSEPVLQRLAYPTGRRVSQYAVTDFPKDLHPQGTTYVTISGSIPETYRLRDGGATRPEWHEQQPIPAPRGKQVRWHDGQWERLTARGWRIA